MSALGDLAGDSEKLLATFGFDNDLPIIALVFAFMERRGGAGNVSFWETLFELEVKRVDVFDSSGFSFEGNLEFEQEGKGWEVGFFVVGEEVIIKR